MSISLSALLRGVNRAGAAYTEGRMRGETQRRREEREEEERRLLAMDRALERAERQRRLKRPDLLDPNSPEALRNRADAELYLLGHLPPGTTRSGQRRGTGDGTGDNGTDIPPLTPAGRRRRYEQVLETVPTRSALSSLTPERRRELGLTEPAFGGGDIPRQRREQEARRRMVAEGSLRADRAQPASDATSPADLWEELVNGGMSEADSTAEVRRRFPGGR